MVRVPSDQPPRGGAGRRPVGRLLGRLSNRLLLAHLAWSALVVAAAGVVIGIELTSACPAGGPLAFGDCNRLRPFVVGVVALGAVLYVGLLSAVVWWGRGLRQRGLADRRAARDWYALAAGIGLLVAPLLAFTLVSAVR